MLAAPSTGADVALVLDYATTPENIERISSFTSSIIDGLDISPSGVHVALITYGANATTVFDFNALQGSQVNRDEVKKLVSTAIPMPDRPRIDKALQVADRELFTTEAGSRPGVPKVMISVLSSAVSLLKDKNINRHLIQTTFYFIVA